MHALHASVLSGFTPALSEDWLYKTIDPFPLATRITALFLKLGPGGVYFLYFVVIAAFVLAFMIFLDSRNGRRDALASYLWSGLTVLSALVLGRLTGLSAGVADQYDPQLDVATKRSRGDPGDIRFVICLPLACLVSGLRCFGSGLASQHSIRRANLSNGRLRASDGRAAVEGALYSRRSVYSPSVTRCSHTIIQFMPTTNDMADKASRILAREKIPFHAIPMQWMTTLDIFKVLMIAIAAYIYRKQNGRLSFVISISLILGIVATVIFAFLDDDRLLLLFPWRVSGVLAPIALILIVSAVLNGLPTNGYRLVIIIRNCYLFALYY